MGAVLATTGAACGGQIDGEGTTTETATTELAVTSKERAVVTKLGLPARFAIGLGNDAEGNDPAQSDAFTLGPKVDIHDAYLVGLPGEGGWTDWNAPKGTS